MRRRLFYCLCALLLLGTRPTRAQPQRVDDTVADGAWPCPAQSPCWLISASKEFVNLIQMLTPLWACPPCTTYIAVPQCDYGGCPLDLKLCYGFDGSNMGCNYCDPRQLLTNNRVYGAGLLSSCVWHNLSVCDAGYYSPSGSNADDTEACLSCLPVAEDCGDGAYLRRCVSDPGSVCLPCTLPQLPPASSTQQMMMRYGPGRLFPDCTLEGYDPHIAWASFSTCAFFQTPKWELGYCDVYCRAGYAQTAAAPSLWELPTCVACATTCAPGFKPPVCLGGYTLRAQSPLCQPCDASLLPDNANWTLADAGSPVVCPWTCGRGFYASGDACVPCGLAMRCTTAGEYWLGCGLNSAGSCRSCASTICVDGRTFRYAPLYADTCECAACARPVLGVSYVVVACNALNDTRIGACSVCSGQQYLARACTLTLDTLCLPCTPPLPGRLLTAQCNTTADAVYAACPPGYACDGSSRFFNCTPPHIASRDGLCVCPLATVEPLCAARACPPAFYPDPADGACRACAGQMTADSIALAASRPGFVGFADACGCVAGYLRASSSGGGRMTCWPCGDLACLVDAEAQTPCDGFTDADPACVCGVGPGMSPPTAAAISCGGQLQCADTFASSSSSNRQSIPPGLYSDYGFVSGLSSIPTALGLNPGAPAPVCAISANITTVVGAGGGADLFVLCSDGTLALHSPGAAVTFSPPLEVLFGETGIRSAVRGVDLSLHTQDGGSPYVWFLFGFWGLCGDELDRGEAQGVPRWCLAVELLTAVHASQQQQPSQQALCDSTLFFCVSMATSRWGNLFPGYGIAGRDGALAWTPSPQSLAGCLFVLVANAGVYRYDIALYADNYAGARAMDYPLMPVVLSSVGASRLAFFVDALLLWTPATALKMQRIDGCVAQHASACVVHDVPYALTGSLVAVRAAQTTTLLVQTRLTDGSVLLYSIDAWNALVSAPLRLPLYSSSSSSSSSSSNNVFAWGAFTTQGALLALNGSRMWQLPDVAPCPIDTFASTASVGACAPMPCTRCGRLLNASTMIRFAGNTTCGCAPGRAGSACALCEPPMQCAGGQEPAAACPDPNAVALVRGATAADCVCLPGHYLFAGVCVRCPRGLWCPFHGTIAPVACAAYGTTLTDGAVSPLECVCPSRTHHFACTPCDGRDVCATPVWPRPTLSAMLWPANPLVCLTQVLGDDASNLVVYSARGVSPLRLDQPWISAHPPLTPSALANVSVCMGEEGNGSSFATAAVSYILPDRCQGRHLEWDGATGCACTGGYETVDTGIYGLRCLPCLNGTMRPSQSPGGCIPCLASAFQEAPYLGMTACACVRGYVADGVTGACVPVGSQTRAPDFVVTATDTNVLMYAGVGASAAALGFAALLGLLVMA